MSELVVENLVASVSGKTVVNGVSFTVNKGEVHAIMGPNGAGKSSLVSSLMGDPRFKVEGKIFLDGSSISGKKPFERAKQGLFLAFQNPREVSGVTISSFLRIAYNSCHEQKLSIMEFKEKLMQALAILKTDQAFANRYLNEGFSGGEKKKSEILQMLLLEPKIVLLDEIDSGLDVDALRIMSFGINEARKTSGVLIVTHYNRILNYVLPDKVHVMVNGKIVATGGAELAKIIEENGYESFAKPAASPA